MSEPKTPMQTRGAGNLAILKKTSSSVYQSRMPARSSRHLKHSHGLAGGRLIKRLDKQSWEERLAKILKVVEGHRYQKNNALYFALANVKELLDEMDKKKADMETYMEELQASNEEMRATNEEMRATNEEMRVLQKELERTHQDTEQILSVGEGAFREPLERVSEVARTLAETHGDQLDPEAVERLGEMAGDAAAVEKTLNGLMGYWRVDVEGQPFENADCETILTPVLGDLKALIAESGAEITHDPLPVVNGDADQIALLFRILLTRAVSLPGDSSPRIHIGAAPMEETDKDSEADDMEKRWVFRVEDNRPEIPEGERERIFNVLQEGGADVMDLAIAWRIVNRHGGEIEVAPKKGGGNVFHFSLPGI